MSANAAVSDVVSRKKAACREGPHADITAYGMAISNPTLTANDFS